MATTSELIDTPELADRRQPVPIRLNLRKVLNAPVIFIIIVVVFGLFTGRQDYLLQGATALTFAIAATGLGLALGLAGEFLLGQLALFATSAYVTAILTTNHQWNFWLAGLVGVVAAVLLGLVLSLIGLRISKFYFALVGFFLVSLIPNLVQAFASQTGGSAGMTVINVPSLFGSQLDNRGMYLLAAAGLALSLLLSRNVRSAPLGIHMRRLRDAPAAVAAAGVSPWRVRMATYVLSSVLAGLGGAIFSDLSGFLQPTQFTLTYTILLFAAVLVGGSTTLLGPSLGVIALYVVPREVVNVQGYEDFIYGAIVLISVIAFRDGIEVAATRSWRRLAGSRRRRNSGTPAADGSVIADPADQADVSAGGIPTELLVSALWPLRSGIDLTRRLTVEGARKRYGGVVALDMEDTESITINPGQVHLLLGPNGSGKTSLLNALCGFARVDSGVVRFGDQVISGHSPAAVARLGVSRSFQTPSLPDETTPVDLLAADLAQLRSVSYAHWLLSDPIAWRARRACRTMAQSIVRAAGLEREMDLPCAQLTSGQRRIVGVLLALASRSSVVLLDEPAAGLSETERQQLGSVIRALAARGIGFVVVEHDLELAMRIADQVTVMAEGHVLAQGTPRDITNHAAVREVLLGGSA